MSTKKSIAQAYRAGLMRVENHDRFQAIAQLFQVQGRKTSC